jgi:hypothetical protein
MLKKEFWQSELEGRGSRWVKDFLVPVFESLEEELGKKVFQASHTRPTDHSLDLHFSKEGNRFEYTIICMMRPPNPRWPSGFLDLFYSYHANNTHYQPTAFKTGEYDIEDVGDREILSHFRRVFQFWLEK